MGGCRGVDGGVALTRTHSKIGASSSERWVNCPGSVRASEGLPNEASIYSAEGTAAHQVAEWCLTERRDPVEYVDREIEVGEHSFTVDEEMAEHVRIYVDFVAVLKADGYEVEVEKQFDLSHLYPGMYGTADCVGYRERDKRLVVVDFKYGRGVAVEPQENKQLLYYGIGACTGSHNRGVSAIELVVVQPRAPHVAGPIRKWETDPVTLLEFSADLVDAAKRTEDADAPLAAGEWCKFCPAAGTCATLANAALAAADAIFTNDGSVIMPDPTKYDPQHLSKSLETVGFVEDWCRRVREYAHHEAIAGRIPPGWKLVPKRPTRKWLPEEKSVTATLFVNGLDDEDIYNKKLKSPAQVEKVFGKKNVPGEVAKMWAPVSSGTVLAPVDDPRQSVMPDAEVAFKPVDDLLDIPEFLDRRK